MRKLLSGKPWLIPIALVVVLALAAALRAGLSGSSAARTSGTGWATGVAAVGDIKVSVSGSGALQPGRVEDVKTAVAGTVRRVLVANGDTVRSGQLLAVLENESVLLSWEQARLTYEAELEKLDDMLAGTAAGTSETARRAAELKVEQARLNLEAKQQLVADLQVKAQAAGQVSTVQAKVGETLNAGAPLLMMLEGPVAQVTVQVPESDIPRVRAGDPGSVILGPLPDVHTITIHLYESSVYGLREGDPVTATVEGMWASVYNPIVRGNVVRIEAAGSFFNVTCRLPGLSKAVPAGANVSYMEIFPSGKQASSTMLTASGKLTIQTDVWGLETAHGQGNGLPARVAEVATQGVRLPSGDVNYSVKLTLDQFPANALAGMSAHAAIQPAAGGGAIYGLTSIETPDRRIVTAGGGKVERVLVQAGDKVYPGQLLVELTNQNLSYQLDQAINDLAAAQENLARITDPASREIKLQEIKLRQAELTLEARGEDVNSLMVTAPQDGRIAALNTNLTEGRNVPIGFSVCRVLNYESMQLVIQVDELEVDLVQPGMAAGIEVDALPGQVFSAEVIEVSQEGQYQQGVSRFGVTIAVEASPRLRSQMTSTATIFVAEKKGVLLIPAEAVTFLGGGDAEVGVLTEAGQVAATRIKIGLYNDAQVEVVSGLTAGAKVVTGEIQNGGLFPSWRQARPGTIR